MGNPVQAMTGLGSVEIAEQARGREITIRIAQESAAVGLELGLPHPQVQRPRGRAVGARPAGPTSTRSSTPMLTPKEGGGRNWRASMAQDVIKGRRSEIDYMNGHVVAKGREMGVPTPVSAAVVQPMREVDAGTRKPAPEHIELALTRAGSSERGGISAAAAARPTRSWLNSTSMPRWST